MNLVRNGHLVFGDGLFGTHDSEHFDEPSCQHWLPRLEVVTNYIQEKLDAHVGVLVDSCGVSTGAT